MEKNAFIKMYSVPSNEIMIYQITRNQRIVNSINDQNLFE